MTGIIFCIAMFYGNAEMAYTMIICTIVSSATAVLLQLNQDHIDNGLYGFNSALIGCAMIFYFGLNAAVVLAYIIGSIASTLLMHLFLLFDIRAYTFPFIAITWLLKLILQSNGIDGFPLAKSRLPGPTIDYNGFDYVGNGLVIPSHAFGQVLFQGDFISGLLMIIAIFINSPIQSLYGIIATHLSVIIINLYYPNTDDKIIISTLNGGLYSFNAVLSGIASSGNGPFYLIKMTITVIISTTFFLHLKLQNFTTLTFPFN
ncbi:urea transport protein [Cavenderia fasciculata]|uniref:Urea transport protein n=1 Tax=Cavenderia fasciculata TaxID=261658 RepID=F4QBE5_CACFS|nr:urea transport protein [Cavenderia fasciculata]EGG14917.1 urea transport protein [Cavenderia fasciculata]|eukprot:XP_004351433.1 urea transport protein [Cavenderia fasciculata]